MSCNIDANFFDRKLKLLIGLMIGSLVISMFVFGFGGFIMKIVLENSEEAKNTTNQTQGIVNKTDLTLTKLSQDIIPRLDRGYQTILTFQNISNQTGQSIIAKIFSVEDNILTNLTRHRTVSNATRDNTWERLDKIEQDIANIQTILNSRR